VAIASWNGSDWSGSNKKSNVRPPPKLKSVEKKDYRRWCSALEDWTYTTDIDKAKWAAEIKQQIEVEEAIDIIELIKKSILHSAEGYEAVRTALNEEFLGERRDKMWETFVSCVIHGKRKPNVNLRDFVSTYSTKLKELDNEFAEGYSLPDELKGLLLAYKAGVDAQQLENLMSITNLSWNGKDIERGLRRLNVSLPGMSTKGKDNKVFLACDGQEPLSDSPDEGVTGEHVSDAETVGSSECEISLVSTRMLRLVIMMFLRNGGFIRRLPSLMIV
jgi:hypothetical protein